MTGSGATTVYLLAQDEVPGKRVYSGEALQKKSLPGFALLLSQAAAAGLFAAFVTSTLRLLSLDFPYNFLLAFNWPESLALGLCVGALKGVTIWGSSRIFRRMPGPFVRSLMSV